MDKNTIFVKTKEGEEAVRQRTRLVQRNLRNILIMVDGHATVADLAKRFGDENAAQAALADLQASSFIVEASGPLDFGATLPPEDLGDIAEDLPILTRQIDSDPAKSSDAEREPQSMPPPVIEEIELPAPEYESLPPPQHDAASPMPPKQPSASGPDWVAQIRAWLARKKEDRTLAPGDLEPIVRGARATSWPILVLLACISVAVLLALTLALYPYGRHLPDIEKTASAMLRDPVKVGGIGFSFMPRPHIVLHNITVGKNAHLIIASARAMPDIFSLLGEKKIFNELALERVSVKGTGLGRLAQADAGGNAAELRHISLSNLSLTVGGILFSGFGGEVVMSGQGAPEKILLQNADGTLKLELQPAGGGYRIAASGSNWKSPFKPMLTFLALDAKGELRDTRLELSGIEGRAYEGLVGGKASLEWDGGAVLSGNLDLQHMNATKLLAVLGTDLSAEGELTARLRLDAKADSLVKLADALHTEATFEMKRGAVKGFDLGEAARRSGNAPTRGGETKFEQLTGSLQCDPQGCRLSGLRLGSGLFKASGNLTIAGNEKVSGGVEVELKSSAATLRMPLTISGSTKDPLLTPGRSR